MRPTRRSHRAGNDTRSSELSKRSDPAGRSTSDPRALFNTNNVVTRPAGTQEQIRAGEVSRRPSAASRPAFNHRSRMSVHVFTPISEETPEQQVEGAPTPAAAAPGLHPPPLSPGRPHVQQSQGAFVYFKDVVEAQARGDVQAASAAFKAINEQLGNLPRDSPQKAEVFAECGLHLLLESRRCKAQQQPDDARTKAQRAVDCLQTSIKLQRTLALPVKAHHYLWLGWVYEFLSRKTDAHRAYDDGIAASSSTTDGVAFELWMAKVEWYTEAQDWQQCWSALTTMLKSWPTVTDLYARAGLAVLRRDFASNPMEALQGALFWYRAAGDLDPSNAFYPMCITRIADQIAQRLPASDAYLNPAHPPFAPMSPPPPPPSNFLDMRSRNSMATTTSEYGEVLAPSQRQFIGMDGEGTSGSPIPPSARPQSVAPILHTFPGRSVPAAPEPWQLPSPSLRSRSAVSSPGPASQKHRRHSASHRTKGLLNRVHEAVKSIHEVARAVTPLRERVRQTQEQLTQQYDHLEGRVDELAHKQDTMDRDFTRRLSDAEGNIQDLRAAPPFDPDEYARRAQSVPPQRFNAASLNQDELLERSIMLYGVWALEKRLGGCE